MAWPSVHATTATYRLTQSGMPVPASAESINCHKLKGFPSWIGHRYSETISSHRSRSLRNLARIDDHSRDNAKNLESFTLYVFRVHIRLRTRVCRLSGELEVSKSLRKSKACERSADRADGFFLQRERERARKKLTTIGVSMFRERRSSPSANNS